MYFDVQVGDTPRRSESIANHGLQRFTLWFNRTAVTLDMTLKLRENMPDLLRSDEGNMHAVPEIKKWIIQDWGGIRRGDSSLQGHLSTAEKGIGTEESDPKREFAIERIASWSKYLAFKYPKRYAIYDARVIYLSLIHI